MLQAAIGAIAVILCLSSFLIVDVAAIEETMLVAEWMNCLMDGWTLCISQDPGDLSGAVVIQRHFDRGGGLLRCPSMILARE